MKIGVYGGTFNPPHLGHVAAARAVMERMGLDELYIVPAGMPPHKDLPPGSPTGRQRLEMASLAFLRPDDQVHVLDTEMCRAGRSYTVETLEAIRKERPADTLWLLMGTDMFLTVQDWHEAGRILQLAGIAAFARGQEDPEERFAAQRERLLRTYPQARIFTLDIPDVLEISSTQVREALKNGEGEALLPPAVYGYILREGLYHVRGDLTRLSLRELRAVAQSYLNRRRVPHVLGTEQEAIRLAVRYGGNVEKARRAALLHDCTKRLDMDAQLRLCERYGIVLDEVERNARKLLHAKTGAEIARSIYGMDDEIVNAIRFHTTGRAHMTLLEKIIYLADYIEPSREFPGVEELRAAVDADLDGGLKMAFEMTVREIEEQGVPIHRATREALEAMKGPT